MPFRLWGGAEGDRPDGSVEVPPGLYKFAMKEFPTRVEKPDVRAVGKKEHWPSTTNRVVWSVRRFEPASRNAMDMCCSNHHNAANCVGCLADCYIVKQHFRKVQRVAGVPPAWEEQGIKGPSGGPAVLGGYRLEFDVHDSKYFDEAASAYTLRVPLGRLNRAPGNEGDELRKYVYVRTILAYRFNPGSEFTDEDFDEASLSYPLNDAGRRVYRQLQRLPPHKRYKGEPGTFWMFKESWEGDHLLRADGLTVPYGSTSLICGVIQGARRAEHMRRDWVRQSFPSFLTYLEQAAAELDELFEKIAKERKPARTLEHYKKEYFKRKRDAAPKERHRVDQSYFVQKYGVDLPRESFEMPVWEGLWQEWSSENPARFHAERARRESVTFRGLPERFAVTGNLKKWKPGEALEFFNDACRVDKPKYMRGIRWLPCGTRVKWCDTAEED